MTSESQALESNEAEVDQIWT